LLPKKEDVLAEKMIEESAKAEIAAKVKVSL